MLVDSASDRESGGKVGKPVDHLDIADIARRDDEVAAAKRGDSFGPKQAVRVGDYAENHDGPGQAHLAQVMLVADDRANTAKWVERLMGTKAEARFEFIQERAEFAREEMLDV